MIDFFKDEDKRTITFLVVSGIALILSFFTADLPISTAWIAILLCGIPIIKDAIVGLVTAFDIKADVLVSIALIAAVCIGEIFAAGEVAFIMAIGAYLEERTVAKARAGIEKLVDLTPATARLIKDGIETEIPADRVAKGDILRVIPGETVAVDGLIVKGHTSIDQSIMTGESLPVDKTIGDEVFSGTVNQFGAFDMQAEKVGEDSSLQRMVRLVESADADKAKIVRSADRWATWIVVIALSAAILTWLFTGEIIRSVTILVVFCPCALVLATPTAIMAGIGNLTRYGVLVKEGDALERLAQVNRIAFDKTGTLTFGKPSVDRICSFHSEYSEPELLKLAASAELLSEHPLGKAIVSYARQTFVAASVPQTGQEAVDGGEVPAELALPQPDDFELLSGRGVVASIASRSVIAGNKRLLDEKQVNIPGEALVEASQFEEKGSTLVYLAEEGVFLGFIALGDSVRPDAEKTIQGIRAARVEAVMLTGDRPQAARTIAASVGISEVKAECTPEDKLDYVKYAPNDSSRVAMVGDGINDAPALKAAYVGIAMGGVGSDIAVDSADIVLVGDDIKVLPHVVQLAQKTMNKINFNLAAAMILNFVAIILAITGVMGPVVGALVHNVGSVAVIINSSLLLNWHQKGTTSSKASSVQSVPVSEEGAA